MDNSGGLVFISHSHFDISVVRRIRNRFEHHGFEPLVFYLKCLNDSDEIEGLIKREINEREWFVFVDSENSRRSAWVKSECEYIKGLTDKKIFTVYSDGDIDTQVDRIATQLQVYISYAVKDLALARRLRDKLTSSDYRVYLSIDELEAGVDFATTVQNRIKHATSSGFILLLVTENTAGSSIIHREIAIAKKNGGIIIPVYIGNAKLNKKQLKVLGEHEPIVLETFDEQSSDILIKELEKRIDFCRGEDFDLSIFSDR